MEDSTPIVELLIAVSRLPEDRRRKRDAWYVSQKEHWIGWLYHYNSPGAYNRKIVDGRDARFVYNHIVCPGLLTYLADKGGVARNLVQEAKEIESGSGTEMTRAGKIRKVIPWEIVHSALLRNGYLRPVV